MFHKIPGHVLDKNSRFFVEEGQFINSTSYLHLCRHFLLVVDAASLWRAEIVKASLPEVNQFTGNCFRVVRIVLKITFLGLRYPGQRPECPSLSYYGSCFMLKLLQYCNYIFFHSFIGYFFINL